MDTGKGYFEQLLDKNVETLKKRLERDPEAKDIFIIGEELVIKGSRFKIKSISPFGIRLQLLKGE